MTCWAVIGARFPPAARTARTCPGVASPSRSPSPADVPTPSVRGSSQGKDSLSAAALRALVGQSSSVPLPRALASPSKLARDREPLCASMAKRGISSRVIPNSASPAETSDVLRTSGLFTPRSPALKVFEPSKDPPLVLQGPVRHGGHYRSLSRSSARGSDVAPFRDSTFLKARSHRK